MYHFHLLCQDQVWSLINLDVSTAEMAGNYAFDPLSIINLL